MVQGKQVLYLPTHDINTHFYSPVCDIFDRAKFIFPEGSDSLTRGDGERLYLVAFSATYRRLEGRAPAHSQTSPADQRLHIKFSKSPENTWSRRQSVRQEVVSTAARCVETSLPATGLKSNIIIMNISGLEDIFEELLCQHASSRMP